MPLAEARAFCPQARFELHDPHADREALRQLALWCQRYSPLVALEAAAEPESLLFDITGCAHLFGGEESLAAKVVEACRVATSFQLVDVASGKLKTCRHKDCRGYWATAAIADTIGAAWAIAHAACGLAFASNPENAKPQTAVVAPRGQTESLRPLPVAALRLPLEVVQLLHQFDLRRIGQLLELPRADLPSRFGLELVQRLDQALGNVPEVLTFEHAEEPVQASWSFEPPTADQRMIETVLAHLLEEVLQRLRPRQMGVERLLCSLDVVRAAGLIPAGINPAARESHELLHVPVGLLQPCASSRHLMELVRLQLERVRVPAEVSALTVRAAVLAPLEVQQGRIFEDDDATARYSELPVLIERLSSRLGEQAVLRPELRPDAQPEFAWRYAAWLAVQIENREWRIENRKSIRASHSPFSILYSPFSFRPPCLKSRPIAIPVMSIIPGGPPLRFEWQGQAHLVAHYWGPERIETGWWRGPDVRRDYYLVETTTGERFWLFRTITEENWFLHGTFA